MRIIISTLIIFLPTMLFDGFIYNRLAKFNEFLTPTELLNSNSFQDESYIYQPRYRYNAYAFKKALLQKKNMGRIVIGSSRAHQFESNVFGDNRYFLNFGGTVRSLDQLYYSLSDIISAPDHDIKEILIVLDFWWFRDNFGSNAKHKRSFNPQELGFLLKQTEYEDKSGVYKFLTSAKRIMLDILGSSEVRELLISGQEDLSERCSNLEPIGMNAILRCRGFNMSGKFIRPGWEIKRTGFDELMLEDNYALKSGRLCMICFRQKFLLTLDLLAYKEISVILVLPPIPEELKNHILQNEGLEYVTELERELEMLAQNNNLEFFDGHKDAIDPALFYDKYHPTWVMFAKLFQDNITKP